MHSDIGLVAGRFQLFHNDHLRYVLAAKRLCNHLIIGITSPYLAHAPREEAAPHRKQGESNPLTYFERLTMISACIIEAGIDSTEFAVTPFPIETPDQLWNYAPLGAVCYLTINDEWGDEKARRLRQQGFKVHVLWRTKTKELSGTELRAAIRHGEHTWESSVPPATVRFLGASGALERIRGDRHPPGFEPGIQ